MHHLLGIKRTAMFRSFCIIPALLFSLAAPATSGPFAVGLAAYEQEDYPTALKVWKPLAELGHAGAQNHLGIMYYFGHAVAQDYVLAHMWTNIAVVNGDPTAEKLRDDVARRMTPDQIADAERMAQEWMARREGSAVSRIQPKIVKTIPIGPDGKPMSE